MSRQIIHNPAIRIDADKLGTAGQLYDIGRARYQADVMKRPHYHNGQPRRQWHELSEVCQWSWYRDGGATA